MYIKGKNRGGQSVLPTHPHKHHKPYRVRHIGLFIAGLVAVILSVFAAGYLLGQSDPIVISPSEAPAEPAKKLPGDVKSKLGYSFKYDPAVFSAQGKTDEGKVTGKNLGKGVDLLEVNLSPKPTAVKGREALSELTVSIERDKGVFDRYKLESGADDKDEALRRYFAPVTDQNFNIEEAGRTSESIDSVKFQKITYVQKPRFGGNAKPVYSVMWIGLSDGKPVRIYLQNLLASGQIPSIYGRFFDTLHFGPPKDDDVLSDTARQEDFDINKVSPAVVKIYHFVCGKLVVNNTSYGQDACDGGSGSGFLVSGDGYIATSGHVVVLEAADIMVSQLLNNPVLLRQFTAAAGLSAEQSSQPDVVASLLAKIYDLPPEKLRLDNRREITFAALGSRPLIAENQAQAKKIFDTPDDDYIKKAEIVAVDYQPKDLLNIEQKDQDGFSASDVALLKINALSTPYIRLAANNPGVEQNSPISLVGFPADADNQLTENSVISPSVTKGTISSVRQANGSASLLFQTDADASEGNSGGPAINRLGQAFGLVTYRFKSGNETNAAKSYIRDIADFSDLVDSKNISLMVKSPAQSEWEAGLDLFKDQRYSKALVKFAHAQQIYPAQRLADSYIDEARRAIREGRDKKDPPYLLIAIITGGVAGGFIAAAGAYLIIRHRRNHFAYKAGRLTGQTVVNPSD